MKRKKAALSEPPPEVNNEPADVTTKRADEMAAAALECAESGHVFYLARDFCGRCFALKPEGWQP